jgi:non-canonical (house-cleaning) NTP pyrophosphatase
MPCLTSMALTGCGWDVLCASGFGRISQARSAEFMLPAKISELVAGGMELGAADDLVGMIAG